MLFSEVSEILSLFSLKFSFVTWSLEDLKEDWETFLSDKSAESGIIRELREKLSVFDELVERYDFDEARLDGFGAKFADFVVLLE